MGPKTCWNSHLNNVENKTIGNTPFHVLYGYYPSFADGIIRHVVIEETHKDVTILQQQIKQRILNEHKVWLERHASNYAEPIKYKFGEIVFIKRAITSTGESTKLQPRYWGPLVIMKVFRNDSYKVAAIRTQDNRRYATTAHVTDLKGYHLVN